MTAHLVVADDVGTDPVARDHRYVVRQTWMPDRVVVRRKVVRLGKGLDMWCLRVVKDSDGTEACEAVVILKHDHEGVVEIGYAVAMPSGCAARGQRQGRSYCQSDQILHRELL